MYGRMHHPERHDTISRYEHDHYRISPSEKKRYTHRMGHTEAEEQHSKQLEVMIPDSEMVDTKSEADLLQVVPKSRDCEDKHFPPTGTSSPNEENPPLFSASKPKTSLLESICSSLKRESAEWDKQDEKLVIDLKEEQKDTEEDSAMESEENLMKLKEEIMTKDYHDDCGGGDGGGDNKSTTTVEDQNLRDKITKDQLERRRKSNREAQRRRRARLKMQGHPMEERHEYEHHEDNTNIEKEKEQKEYNKRYMKNRPDSLYMPPGLASYEPYSRPSYHHTTNKEGRLNHEKIHYLHDPKYDGHHEQFHHGNKHPFYPSPRHRNIEMEDGPPRKHHVYYPPPEYHHHPHNHREHTPYRYHHETMHPRHHAPEQDRPVSRSPHHPASRSPHHPASRSPHHPASRSPHHSASRSPRHYHPDHQHNRNQHSTSTENSKGMRRFSTIRLNCSLF